MKKVFYTIFILTTFSGCTQYPDLGNGYKLDSDGKYALQLIDSENTVLVQPHIMDYAFDSTFIIISQRSWDSVLNSRQMNMKQSIESFENSTFQHYWIIDKMKKSDYSLDTLANRAIYSNVYGPFTKQEYIQNRRLLGISNDLVLTKNENR
jgi:hypothetical protein